MARTLQPAMVVVEDVDLIAEERGKYPGQHPLLFQLLNEMDGLAEDADVVFVLTTNRADLLEPALAARPGRVDQAVELGLPDAHGPPGAARALPGRPGRWTRPPGPCSPRDRGGHRVLPQGAAAPGGRDRGRRPATRRPGAGGRAGGRGRRGRHRGRHGRRPRGAARHPQRHDPGPARWRRRRLTTRAVGRDGTSRRPVHASRAAGPVQPTSTVTPGGGSSTSTFAVDVAPHAELVAGEPQTADRQRPERCRTLRSQRQAPRAVCVEAERHGERRAADAADHACGRHEAG